MPVCLTCGHSFKTKWNDSRKTVNGCSRCTKLFSDKAMDDMIKEFMK